MNALFGTESSGAAFARQSISIRRTIEGSPGLRPRQAPLSYGEFALPFFSFSSSRSRGPLLASVSATSGLAVVVSCLQRHSLTGERRVRSGDVQ